MIFNDIFSKWCIKPMCLISSHLWELAFFGMDINSELNYSFDLGLKLSYSLHIVSLGLGVFRLWYHLQFWSVIREGFFYKFFQYFILLFFLCCPLEWIYFFVIVGGLFIFFCGGWMYHVYFLDDILHLTFAS